MLSVGVLLLCFLSRLPNTLATVGIEDFTLESTGCLENISRSRFAQVLTFYIDFTAVFMRDKSESVYLFP